MTHRTPQTQEREAMRLLTMKRSQREVARRTGLSKTAVQRLAAAMKPPKSAVRVTRPPVQSAPDPRDLQLPCKREIDQMFEAAEIAGDDVASADAWVAQLRQRNPALDACIVAGASLVEALIEHSDLLFCLRRPEDIAELVLMVTEEPGGGYDPDPGETAQAFAAFLRSRGEAERERARALLTQALEIVSQTPVADRWLKPVATPGVGP